MSGVTFHCHSSLVCLWYCSVYFQICMAKAINKNKNIFLNTLFFPHSAKATCPILHKWRFFLSHKWRSVFSAEKTSNASHCIIIWIYGLKQTKFAFYKFQVLQPPVACHNDNDMFRSLPCGLQNFDTTFFDFLKMV